MKKVLLFSILLLWAGSSWAQLSNYAFSSSTGTYSPITGGAVLGDIASDDQRFVDPASPLGGSIGTGVGFPIGFNFTFDGVVYDRFAVNNNGWISLGQSALNPTAVYILATYTPISTTTTVTPAQLVSRISGFARDLVAQAGAELRIQTIGTTPNQECVIQWKGYKRYGSTGTGDNYNFQIRLIETSNQVKIVYGVISNNATATTVQVGLRGAPASPASNYANRVATTDWAATTPGAIATATCVLSNAIYPASGITFTYSVAGVLNPLIFTATPVGTSQVNLAFTPNSGNNVVIIWDLDNTFAAPDGTPPAVNQPFAGGTLLYNGLVSPQYHTGLTSNEQYFYMAYSYNGTVYSSGLYATATTFCDAISDFPYEQGFEGSWPPSCWTDPVTANYGWFKNTYGGSHSGSGWAYCNLASSELFAPPMTIPSDCMLKFWYRVESASYPQNMAVKIGSNVIHQITGASNIDYQQVEISLAAYSGQTVAISFLGQTGTGGSSAYGICIDDIYLVPPSALEGYVYDFDGNPLVGATVESSGGISAISGTDGYYFLSPIDPGIQGFQCFKTGYNFEEEIVDIPLGATVTQDFTLTNPEMTVEPGSIFAILGTNATGAYNLEITNDGNGPLAFIATEISVESCEYTIELTDNYGDGWNGGKMDVMVNGTVVLDDITLMTEDAAGPKSWTFNVSAGDEITTLYSPGSYAYENVYKIFDHAMTEVYWAEGAGGPQSIPPGQLFGACDVEWLSLDITAENVAPNGGTQTIIVTLDAAQTPPALAPGVTYTTDILFTSPSGIESVTVPVTLVVTDGGLKGPQELAMYIVNEPEGKFMLKWKYFTIRELQFEHFVVLRNGEILGTTIDSFFDEVLTEPGSYCYEVYAVYNNGAYSEPSNEVCMAYPLAPGVPVSNWALLLGALLIGTYAVFMIRRRT